MEEGQKPSLSHLDDSQQRKPQALKRFVRSQILDSILHDPALNAAIALLPSNYHFEVHKCVWRVRSTGASRVALQLPEGLLMYSLVLHVIYKGTGSEMVQASLVNASFWKDVKILRLRQNMRSINDPEFAGFLLQVGNGVQPIVIEDMIQLPSPMVIAWEGEESINQLVNEVFPNLDCHVNDAENMVERAIITPKNDDVDVLNERIIKQFSGHECIVYSDLLTQLRMTPKICINKNS